MRVFVQNGARLRCTSYLPYVLLTASEGLLLSIMTACPEAMAAVMAATAPRGGFIRSALPAGSGRSRRLSVEPPLSTSHRALTHRLTAEGLDECWLAPARALQDRTDQPLPHDLTVDDFRTADQQADGRWASRSSSVFEPILSAGEPKWRSREVAAAPVYNPIQPLLYGIAGGAGLSLLRMNTTARHRQLLKLHSPHELALAAVGLSLRLGVKPLQCGHLLHSTQKDSVHSDSRPRIPSEVTMVACLQDCATYSENGVNSKAASDMTSCLSGAHNVWATKASDLFDSVSRQLGPHSAQLLLEPRYSYSSAALQRTGAAAVEDATSVFQITQHRAASRLQAIDPAFGTNWSDGAANPALSRIRILMDPSHVQVASSGTQAHADALESLQRAARGFQSAQQVRWDRLQLLAGDVLVADNTILLSSTEPKIHDGDAVQELQGRCPQGTVASVYEEVAVLRACAKSRQAENRRTTTVRRTNTATACEDNNGDSHGATTHALWVGMTIHDSPLKWWWW